MDFRALHSEYGHLRNRHPAGAKPGTVHALRTPRPSKPGTASTPCDRFFPRGGLAPWQVNKLVKHIEAHAEHELLGYDLARIVGLSPCHFIRAFKASFGETPHAYVMRHRLLKAQKMMLESDQNLVSIAFDCGFADQAHFCRRFRRVTGTSPRKWRLANRARATPGIDACAATFR